MADAAELVDRLARCARRARRRRPRGDVCPVVSHGQFNARSGTGIAMALTSQAQRAGFPLTYAVPERKFPKPSWVKISQLRTLSTERLGHKVGRIEPSEVDRVVEGLLDVI